MFICLFVIKKDFCFSLSCKTFCPFWKSYWKDNTLQSWFITLWYSRTAPLHIYWFLYPKLSCWCLSRSGPCLFTHCALETPLPWPSAYSYSETLLGHLSTNVKQTSPACVSHCGTEMSINGDVQKSFRRVTRARIWARDWRRKAGELAHCACPLHRLLGGNNFPKTCLMQPKKQWHRSSRVCFLSAGILLLQAPQCFGL